MGDEYLGEFEHLVLLAIVQLGPGAHGAPIRRLIAQRAERGVSLGAVYSTLRRLHAKGHVQAHEQPAESTRGGRPRRVFRLTPGGQDALDAARRRLRRMSAGVAASVSTAGD